MDDLICIVEKNGNKTYTRFFEIIVEPNNKYVKTLNEYITHFDDIKHILSLGQKYKPKDFFKDYINECESTTD